MKKVLLMIPVILFLTIICLAYAITSEVDLNTLLPFLPVTSTGEDVQEESNGVFKAPKPGEYDSKDTAIIAAIDTDKGHITFLNKTVNKFYTLSYDGLSAFYDKYGTALSAPQLKCGDIVDIAFRRGNKYLVNAKESQQSWSRLVRDGFEINNIKKEINFGDEIYSLGSRMVLLSGKEEINLQDFNINDTISVKGIDKTVYSICVDKGHGYLRLTGDEYFTGGFIEVGQRIFTKITGDMLLTVPEGSYKVSVRNGRHGGSKETVIYRDEETVLDVSDLKGEELRTGNVFFTLNPQDASVYIDGNKVDTSTAVELEYGIHSMIVTATGYETISQYLRVGQENANLDVSMDRSVSDIKEDPNNDRGDQNLLGTPGNGLLTDENGNVIVNDPTYNPEENALYDALPVQPSDGTSGYIYNPSGAADQNLQQYITNPGQSTTTPNTTTPNQNTAGTTVPNQNTTGATLPNQGTPNASNTITAGSSNYQVKLLAPQGAEVYVDGSYVGVIPVAFNKKPGSRVISLRKTGYQTRSYTVQVDNNMTDMQLSFSELEPSASSSGNTSSALGNNNASSALTNALVNSLTGNVLGNTSSNMSGILGN